MFGYLKPYGRVLVTGPQRSGTTIAAQMIAADTGKRYVDELEFDVEDVERWAALVAATRDAVIQCPSMCRYVHRFGAYPDVAIVLMRRPLDEIVASQRRIGWNQEEFELARYGATAGPVAAVKYEFWESRQRVRIQNAFEVDHATLRGHALWIPRVARQDFHPRQTS